MLRGPSSTLALNPSCQLSFDFILFGHQIDRGAFFFEVDAVYLDLHFNFLLPALLPELPGRVLEATTQTGFGHPGGDTMS